MIEFSMQPQNQPTMVPDLSNKKFKTSSTLQEVTDNGATTDVATTFNNTLDINADRTGNISKVNRIPASPTDGVYGTQALKAEHTGDMGDGFGVSQTYLIEDNAGVENTIANIQAQRDGADNTGRLVLRTYNAGTPIANQILYADGWTVFDSGAEIPIVDAESVVTRSSSTFTYTDEVLTNITYANTLEKDITYNVDGTINTLVITLPDLSTITKTFNWTAGVLNSVTIV